MAPFHAVAELKQNGAGKDVNVTNKSTKEGPPNRQIGLPLNSSIQDLFISCMKVVEGTQFSLYATSCSF